MPVMSGSRRGSRGSIGFGLLLLFMGALPMAAMAAAEDLLHPQYYPPVILGFVALGSAAVFAGVIVLSVGIVSWLFGHRRET